MGFRSKREDSLINMPYAPHLKVTFSNTFNVHRFFTVTRHMISSVEVSTWEVSHHGSAKHTFLIWGILDLGVPH